MTAVRAQRGVLLGSAAAVTLAAWAWLLANPHHTHSALMPECHRPNGPWSFLSLVAMWQIMMIAMMTPAVIGWLLAFSDLNGHRVRPVAAFAGGYFVVWLGYSLAGSVFQTALQRTGWLTGDGRLPSVAAGVVLIAAGALYFTPLSRSCLKHCRNPLTYFLARWDNGPRGGFVLGLSHGTYCVGCCWALMLTGFAMGVMNMLWMAFLTVLIALEKLAPRGDRIGAIGAAALIVWGAILVYYSR